MRTKNGRAGHSAPLAVRRANQRQVHVLARTRKRIRNGHEKPFFVKTARRRVRGMNRRTISIWRAIVERLALKPNVRPPQPRRREHGKSHAASVGPTDRTVFIGGPLAPQESRRLIGEKWRRSFDPIRERKTNSVVSFENENIAFVAAFHSTVKTLFSLRRFIRG